MGMTRQALDARSGETGTGSIGAADDIAVGAADAPESLLSPSILTTPSGEVSEERARELLAAANEPRPTPMPEQDCRVGEAMAARSDDLARKAWIARTDAAKDALVNELPGILAALSATPTVREVGGNVVDEARALIVATLDKAADHYPADHGSHHYLSGMARKVEHAEAVTIDSYLVLDCVIAARKSQGDGL